MNMSNLLNVLFMAYVHLCVLVVIYFQLINMYLKCLTNLTDGKKLKDGLGGFMQRCEYRGYVKVEGEDKSIPKWLPGKFIGLGQGLWSNFGGTDGRGGYLDQPVVIVQPDNSEPMLVMDPCEVIIKGPYLRKCWVKSQCGTMYTESYLHYVNDEIIVEDIKTGEVESVYPGRVRFKKPEEK